MNESEWFNMINEQVRKQFSGEIVITAERTKIDNVTRVVLTCQDVLKNRYRIRFWEARSNGYQKIPAHCIFGDDCFANIVFTYDDWSNAENAYKLLT